LLTVLLAISSSAADYLENQGLSGARKRSAEDEDSEDSDSSSSSGSRSLGSQDTPPNKMSGNNKSASKKPPTPAKGEASAKPSTKTGDSEVDTLTSRMKSLQLSKSRDWGFSFTGPLPYFWWSYNYGGVRHLKMEVLMGLTPWHQDIQPTVSESGEYLIVYCKLPDFFLNVGRLFGYYHHEVNDAPTFAESDAMFAQGVEATREIKALLEAHGGAQTATCIKLPFKVLANFTDPYHPDETGTGFGLRSYVHEKNPVGGNLRFTVLSVTMQDAKAVRVKASLDHANAPTDADVMNRFA